MQIRHFVALTVFAVASQAPATLVLDLSKFPGNIGSPVLEWTFQADGSSVAVASGATYSAGVDPGLSGSLAGASGSFLITISAIETFDPGDFSAELSTGANGAGSPYWAFDGGNLNYGVRSPAPNEQAIQIAGNRADAGSSVGFSSEAMLMEFDLSNLTLGAGLSLQVDGFLVFNEAGPNPGGQRISYLQGGEGSGNTPVQLTGDSGEPNALVAGNGVFQPLGQSVNTADEIAIWAVDNTGQKRFMGFQFSVIPEPSSVALILMGAAGLSLLRRRR